MRLMMMVFAALLTGIFIVLLPMQNQENSIARPAYTVGVVLKAMDSEHWLAVRSSIQEAAQEKNIRLIVMTPENESAYDEQNQIIEDLFAGGIDALIVSPVNIHHTDQWVQEAKERGLPLLTIDEKIDGIPYVGSDNYAIGQTAAKEMAARLPEGASVGIIAGSANQDAHIQRVAGFRDYLSASHSLQLVDVEADETKYRQATIETEQMLKTHPDLQGLFVTSAMMTLGAIDATETHTPAIHIIGVDTQNDTLAALKRGRIDAMISQDGHETGQLAINVIMDLLSGTAVEENNFIENDVITQDKADEYQIKEE